jgi:hypothetical protein
MEINTCERRSLYKYLSQVMFDTHGRSSNATY